MRESSCQSARSQIPGSRSSQRPCVSAMSSAPGANTSKMNRPVGARHRATARRAVRRSASVSMCSRDRNGQMTSGNVPSTGGSRRSPWRRSSSHAGELGALARDLEHPGRQVDADDLDPRGRDRHGDPPGADAELEHRAARARRLFDVERHVLDDAVATTGRTRARFVVGGHVSMLSTRCTRTRRRSLRGPGAQPGASRSVLQPHRGLTELPPRGSERRNGTLDSLAAVNWPAYEEEALAAVASRAVGERARRRARPRARARGPSSRRRCAACATARAGCS